MCNWVCAALSYTLCVTRSGTGFCSSQIGISRGGHSITYSTVSFLRCIACLSCGGVCPSSALVIAVAVIYIVLVRFPGILSLCYSRCLLCSWCDLVCPTCALEHCGGLYGCWSSVCGHLWCFSRLLGRVASWCLHIALSVYNFCFILCHISYDLSLYFSVVALSLSTICYLSLFSFSFYWPASSGFSDFCLSCLGILFSVFSTSSSSWCLNNIG